MTGVERLDEEFVKVLKGCDAHSNEYVERLKDEPVVVGILDKAEKLTLKGGSPSEVCRIYLKRIEHIYFKFDPSVIDIKSGKQEPTEVEPLYRFNYFLLFTVCIGAKKILSE